MRRRDVRKGSKLSKKRTNRSGKLVGGSEVGREDELRPQ